MFSLKFIKFLAVSALIFLVAPACRFWQAKETPPSEANTTVVDEIKSKLPFSTAEPDVFQAEIVVTANDIERRTFIAGSGVKRRYDYNYGAKNQLTMLRTDKNLMIFPAKKLYAEMSAQNSVSAPDDWQEFLTNEWLSAKTDAKFEKLETVGNTTKYSVVMSGNNASEVFIYVDEKIGLPVREEFFSTANQPEILTFSVEIKNLKLETDEKSFAVPTDFKQVSAADLRKEINKDL